MSGFALPGFDVLEELASGGMGTVYVARRGERVGGRLVVLKRLHPHLSADPDSVTLFEEEAQLGLLLSHACLVPVLEVVEHGEERVIVQELIDSLNLAQLLKLCRTARTRLPLPIVARIVGDVLAGLHAAHELVDLDGRPLQLVHRDISPQNVLVGFDGVCRLIDFGVSRVATAAPTSGTVVRGKFPYLSPEQVNQRELDRRADLFAVGALLHEAITGKRLFQGDDATETMTQVLVAPIPAPSERREEVPAALDAVVLRALARERDERFQTALELETALEGAVRPATRRELAAYLLELAGEWRGERQARLRAAMTLADSSRDESSDASAGLPPAVVPDPSVAARSVGDQTSNATARAPRGPSLLALVLGAAATASTLALAFTLATRSEAGARNAERSAEAPLPVAAPTPHATAAAVAAGARTEEPVTARPGRADAAPAPAPETTRAAPQGTSAPVPINPPSPVVSDLHGNPYE